jgi:hypothetical protein
VGETFVIIVVAAWQFGLTSTVSNAQSVAISEVSTPVYSMPSSVSPGSAGMARWAGSVQFHKRGL